MWQLWLVQGSRRTRSQLTSVSLPIAVDAMGGDNAPEAIIEGCRTAVAEHGISVVLVGLPDVLAQFDLGGIPVEACTEVIAMDDEPGASVRKKKDSSLVRCAELVRDGKASAMMSAGNTGATMASALLRIGRIKGVHRPAIATALPKRGLAPTIMLDGGANVEVQPSWLVQFAQMGSAYSSSRFGIERPRVGLLTIGEEAGKGTALVKQVFSMLSEAPGINFIGNAEGRDLLTSHVDVVVTDGFTGNVCLKALEGCLKFMVAHTLRTVNESGADQDMLDQTVIPALNSMFESLSPDTYGGAMLLGTDGVCVVSHGSSSAHAIATSLATTAELVERDLVGHLRAAVGATS